MKPTTIELLEEKVEKITFLDSTQKVQAIKKQKPINWTSLKLNHHSLKATTKKMKRQTTDWKKILTKYISDKRLVDKIYKRFFQFKVRNNSLNRHFTEEEIPMADKYIKTYSISFTIREI